METETPATFMDLFLMAFIAVIILNTVQSGESNEITSFQFYVSYNSDSNLSYDPLIVIETPEMELNSDDDRIKLNISEGENSISGSLEVPKGQTDIVLNFFIKDDFLRLNGQPVYLKIITNFNGIDEQTINDTTLYSYSQPVL